MTAPADPSNQPPDAPHPENLPPDQVSPDQTTSPRPERGPVKVRSPLPDVLRGVALLGILVVNMQEFAGFHEWQQRGLDSAVQVITDIFANGRFISIFAMLFGWGAAGMLAKQGSGVFIRRHLVLLVIGSLHFLLVWRGDIIANYALLAFTLLITTRMNTRALLGLAGVLGTWYLILGFLAAISTLGTQNSARWNGLPDLNPGDSYLNVVSERLSDFTNNLIGGSIFNGPWLVALFCLGVAAQRTGLLTRPHEHVRTLLRLRNWGLLTGVPLGVLLAWLNTQGDNASGLFAIPVRMGGGLASALGYVGLIGLLSVQGRLGWLHLFATSGRVAMSNYLAQSLIMTTIFYPYAGAQWGQWGAAAAVTLALSVGLLQIPISAWWLRTLGSGPMEKLVRTLVYGPSRTDSTSGGA